MFLKRIDVWAVVLVAMMTAQVAWGTTIAQWTFNEYAVGEDTIGSDHAVMDESGNNRHLRAAFGWRDTVVGPGGSTAAQVDGGKFFDFIPGFSDFVGPGQGGLAASSSDLVFPAGSNFTIEVIAWLPQNPLNGHSEGFLVGRGKHGDTDQYGLWAYNAGSGSSQPNTVGAFISNEGIGPLWSNIDQRNNPPAEGWHHVAMVRDRANDTLSLYIDGSLEKMASGTAGGLDVDEYGSHNLIVGGDYFKDGSIKKPYQGTIDFVRISDVALDPSEFQLVDVIPEPASLALVGLGGLTLLRRRH